MVDAIKSKTTWPPRSDMAAAAYKRDHLYPPSNCVFGEGDTLLKAHDIVLGHPVVVIRHDSVGNIRVTSWKAPDLGCVQLQYRVEKKEMDGSYQLMSQEKAVSLQLTEPNPQLFDTGQFYTEMRPSDMSLKAHAFFGFPIPSGQVAETDTRFDAIYFHDWTAHPDWAGH